MYENIDLQAVEGESQVALGASLSEDQRAEMLMLLNDEDAKDVLTIDGTKVNEYLDDGSDDSVGIYSSAKVEFMKPGYGVHVFIVTPENITKVTESMYQNAAIVAGVNNVDIQIAAPQEVTGEGALAGVYEMFSQQGMALDQESIKIAEKQIQLEQFMAEETSLSASEISKFIIELNLAIVNAVDGKDELKTGDIQKILEELLESNGYDFTNKVKEKIYEHGVVFSKSSTAKDPKTTAMFEESLASYASLEEIFAKKIEVKDGVFQITDVRILQPGEENNFGEVPLLAIWYEYALNDDVEPMDAQVAWITHVKAIQDNDANVVNELMVGLLPDEKYLDSQFHELKPGGKTDMAISYELDEDFETPIKLEFYNVSYADKVVEEIELTIAGINQ